MDRGAWWATVHRVAKSQTRLKQLGMHAEDTLKPCQKITQVMVVQSVKNLPAVQETLVRSLGWEDPLKKEMANLSSILAWKNPMDYSLPGSSVHGIFQTRVLERVTISFSRGSSQPRDQTQDSCTAGRFFTD